MFDEYRMARIIFLNGTSSAGKSTLARQLRERLQEPFCYYASDQLADAGFRPEARSHEERERFFDGFHRSIAAFADAGNHMVVEHIVETEAWGNDLRELLAKHDVLWVGVHAPMHELERRERERGDRKIGEAAFHLKTHRFCRYDLEVDSTAPDGQAVEAIIACMARRAVRSAG